MRISLPIQLPLSGDLISNCGSYIIDIIRSRLANMIARRMTSLQRHRDKVRVDISKHPAAENNRWKHAASLGPCFGPRVRIGKQKTDEKSAHQPISRQPAHRKQILERHRVGVPRADSPSQERRLDLNIL